MECSSATGGEANGLLLAVRMNRPLNRRASGSARRPCGLFYFVRWIVRGLTAA